MTTNLRSCGTKKSRRSDHRLVVLPAAVLVVMAAASARAAVLPVTDALFVNDAGDPVTGEQFDNTYVASVTSGGTVYPWLIGPTVTSITGTTVFHAENEPLPTPAEALSGLIVSNSMANVTAVDFGLGMTVDAGSDSRFFMFEVGGNDAITVTPLDAVGTPIGSWSLTLQAADYGPQILLVDVKMNGGNLASDVHGFALTFGLDDFTGGTGTLSGVAGLRFNGNTGWDPIAVGVAALVPEPATWVLLGTGLLGLAAIRRRRRRL